MLNSFPDLLTYALLGPFLLRVTVGIILLSFAYTHLIRQREAIRMALSERWKSLGPIFVWHLGTLEIIAGVLLIVGFLTQIAALLVILISLKMLVLKRKHAVLARHSTVVYVLILAIALSLLITGAGAFAFDLPL